MLHAANGTSVLTYRRQNCVFETARRLFAPLCALPLPRVACCREDEELLPVAALPSDRRHVYHYTFDGLGPARTLLLGEAWARFGSGERARPPATHFFLADPDWRFDLAQSSTVSRPSTERGCPHGASHT